MRQLLFFIFLGPLLCFGQFSDNFSDGDFSENPTWLGHTDNFMVTEAELQLNDADVSESTSQLYSNVLTADSTNWSFYVRMEFSPSSSNFAKVYLQSDNSDLTSPLNGYFVKVGGITGSDDAIELYRQTGSEETLLITGQAGGVGTDPAEARVQVRRDNAGNWELWADYSEGNNLILQGTALDDTHNAGSYLGVTCTYTSTRKDLFFFDDFLVEPLFVDTAAPQLLSATALSSMEVDLVFDEPLDAMSIIANNFSIDNDLVVVSADLDMDNPTLVHLVLNDNLQNGVNYQITANNISDANNNILASETATFSYFELSEAAPFDILINEFFADKSPQIGLPDGEFIELYNRSDSKVFDLQDLSIADATLNFVNLPSFILEPNSYVILCEASIASLYAPFGDVVALAAPPSLNDSGDAIILQNNAGVIIHSVDYTKDWISDIDKQEGGWSYELINPGSPCLGNQNWEASENLAGGTPGQENSIYAFSVDNTAPSIVSALAIGDSQIRLVFSENLETTAIEFSIDNGLSISAASVNGTNAVLTLGESLQVGTTYTVSVNNASDCLGNSANVLAASFVLPEPADVLDVVVNEILFDPFSGGVDFVELYNRSNKVLNLKGIEISNTQNEQMALIEADYILEPDSFVVITESAVALSEMYFVRNPQAVLVQDLPSFNNDFGNVSLLYQNSLIDAYDYSEEQHYPFLDDVEGVSLERLNPEGISNATDNWHSAASSVGFATPTYQNSQFFQSMDLSNSIFALPYSTFSPDGDGYNDFLLINYETNGVGYTSNIKVFDSKGRFVKNLLRSELLASSGAIKWDGSTLDGLKARMGIYVIWIELYNTEGETQHFKETCVLINKL